MSTFAGMTVRARTSATLSLNTSVTHAAVGQIVAAGAAEAQGEVFRRADHRGGQYGQLVRGGRANPGERSEQRAGQWDQLRPSELGIGGDEERGMHRRSAEPARRLGGRAEIGERDRLALVDEPRRPGVLHHGRLDRA